MKAHPKELTSNRAEAGRTLYTQLKSLLLSLIETESRPAIQGLGYGLVQKKGLHRICAWRSGNAHPLGGWVLSSILSAQTN